MQDSLVHRTRDEPQSHGHFGGAAIGALERHGQLIAQPAEHERQRLEPFDRIFELESLDESHSFADRHERHRIFATGSTMPSHAERSEP